MTGPGEQDEPDTGDDPLHRLRELTGDDPRLQAGIDHLQRAAREVIAASRALLDVADDLVDDPRALGGVVGLLGSVSELATRFGRPGAPPRTWTTDHDDEGDGPGDDGDDDPPVQRIPVS